MNDSSLKFPMIGEPVSLKVKEKPHKNHFRVPSVSIFSLMPSERDTYLKGNDRHCHHTQVYHRERILPSSIVILAQAWIIIAVTSPQQT